MINLHRMFCVLGLFLTYTSQVKADDTMDWKIIGTHIEKKQIVYQRLYRNPNVEFGMHVNCTYPNIKVGYGQIIGIWSVEQNKTIET